MQLCVHLSKEKSAPARPALQGDLWESIGTLNMPSSSAYSANSIQVLVPQKAPLSKRSPVKVTAWGNIDSNAELSNSIRFANVLSHIVSTTEIDLQHRSAKVDRSIDFEVLIPSSNSGERVKNATAVDTNVNLLFVQPLPPKKKKEGAGKRPLAINSMKITKAV